jgi:MYXO-CTERM domain-containing protein
MGPPPVMDMGTPVVDMNVPQPDAMLVAQSSPPVEDCGCSFEGGQRNSFWWLLLLLGLRPRRRNRGE